MLILCLLCLFGVMVVLVCLASCVWVTFVRLLGLLVVDLGFSFVWSLLSGLFARNDLDLVCFVLILNWVVGISVRFLVGYLLWLGLLELGFA